MKNLSHPLFKHIHPILWQSICFIVSIGVFSLILLNRSPNLLRPLSMSLRNGFGLVIPLTALILYLCFRIPGRLGDLISMTAVMSLFAMPLAGLWASGQTQTTVLSGLIPLYDADAYYIDALRLIHGYDFSIVSARRVLFPGLLATLLSLTNQNLMASLAILTGIVGIACYIAAREIQRTHGGEISVFIVIVIFLFFRAHSGVSMTENLGVALGVLGFTLLWQGASIKNSVYMYSGVFVTTLALNARAGAFFLLPILILWTGWLLRKNNRISWKTAFYAACFVAAGFTLNILLTRLLAVPSGIPFANFSYTLYGLASGGKSWGYIYEAHPEIFSLDEPQQTMRIYQVAFELIREKPLQAIQGALFNWRMLFSDSWYNIYAYVGGENWILNVCARWTLYLLGLTGIYAWSRDRNDPIKSLIIVSFFGVLISVPFLPPTDAYRMRPYAASIIILAALPALGLSFILKKSGKKNTNTSNVIEVITPFSMSLTFTTILLLISLTGPVILKINATPIYLKPAACKGNSDFVITRFDEGTYITVKRENQYFLDWMPNFHKGQFGKNAHSLADANMIHWAESLQPPATVFLSLDFHTNQKVLVALASETIPTPGRYYQFCGESSEPLSSTQYAVFYTNEVLPLSP